MKDKVTYIDAGMQDMSRPKNRPPKHNWKTDMIKKSLQALQHVSPQLASTIIWKQFTKPGRTRFTEPQLTLLKQATIEQKNYQGHTLYAYRWGHQGPKVLLSHGWRSKIADFRRLILALTEAGFVVEGIDMKAHGQSGGTHTALPEFRSILKEHYVKHAPYHAVIGYSLGGLAAGIALSEVSPSLHPQQVFLLATPPYPRYFFYDIVQQLGCKQEVYEAFCNLVEATYYQPIDYFDLRQKHNWLSNIDLHLLYDENDEMVTLAKGQELQASYSQANFVHTKGLGHYKIIAYQAVIDYIVQQTKAARQPVAV